MQNITSDAQSQDILVAMNEQDRVKSNRIAGVRTVLVVLSSKGIVFDTYALRHEIRLAYPDATVFFRTTLGQPIGAPAPAYVDLVIDLTGPGQRQPWLYSRKLRRGSRVAVGRNAGLFRKSIYDKIFDEKAHARSNPGSLPYETLEKERFVQKKVLELAGVAMVPTGETHPDRGKTIALALPPMQRL